MAKLTRIYWRDIPSQVTVKAGRKSAKILLPERFQVAIDSAAMRAGKGTADDYLEDWKQIHEEVQGELDALAQQAADELIAKFPEKKLQALVKAQGFVADLPDT